VTKEAPQRFSKVLFGQVLFISHECFLGWKGQIPRALHLASLLPQYGA